MKGNVVLIALLDGYETYPLLRTIKKSASEFPIEVLALIDSMRERGKWRIA
jgi:hypothetical protein